MSDMHDGVDDIIIQVQYLNIEPACFYIQLDLLTLFYMQMNEFGHIYMFYIDIGVYNKSQ